MYAARHRVTQRSVAVKIIDLGKTEDPDMAQARFMREAELSEMLRHPNITENLDAGIDAKGHPYLVMDLLVGTDLEGRLATGTVDALQLSRWMLKVLDVLKAAHELGFVHRDIKPSNIFLERKPDGSEEVKVLDFGLVKRLGQPAWHRRTRSEGPMGTPAYMSPEQIGTRDVTPQADLWSVGAVMFHGLTGRPPVEGDTVMRIFRNLLRGKVANIFEEPRFYPPELRSIIQTALQVDRQQRWPSAKAMAAALADFIRFFVSHDPFWVPAHSSAR